MFEYIAHLEADAALLGAALEHLVWRRDLREELVPPAARCEAALERMWRIYDSQACKTVSEGQFKTVRHVRQSVRHTRQTDMRYTWRRMPRCSARRWSISSGAETFRNSLSPPRSQGNEPLEVQRVVYIYVYMYACIYI